MTKDSVGGKAGELIEMRPWQQDLINALLTENPATGRLLYRQALIGIARKNGKSAFGSSLALYGLVFGGQGTEVYSCAGEKEQARIVFGEAKRMVEMDPELRDIVKPYRDALEIPATNSVYRALSAEAFSKEGLNPSLVIFDEVHVQPNWDLWNVMQLAGGARLEPLMVGITTAGVRTNSLGEDTLCYSLYEHGKRVAQGLEEDPSFFFAWWEPEAAHEADHRDPKVWAEANPGLGDIVSTEDFESALARTPEPEFRTKRTNVFVSSAASWLPYGAWEACAAEVELELGDSVVLGFDGSYNGDSTAIVAATVGAKPLVDIVKVWEKPIGSEQDWTVPIEEVEQEIRDTCKKYRVREVVCDPYRWARSMQILSREGIPIVEYPQSPERMVPATQRFYEAVLNDGVVQTGNKTLAKHIGNCVLKVDQRGSRIVKAQKTSSAKIDAAIAAVMAYDRAAGRPTVGAGWMAYLKSQTNKIEPLAETPEPPEADEPPVAPPPPAVSPRQYFQPLDVDAPKVQPRASCKHRWWDNRCVFCGGERKE